MNVDQIDGVGGIEGDGPDAPGRTEKPDGGPEQSEGLKGSEEAGGVDEAAGAEKADGPGEVGDATAKPEVDPSDHGVLRPEDQIDTPSSHLPLLERIHELPGEGSPLEKKSEERISEMSEGFKEGDEGPVREMLEKLLNDGF